MLAVLQLEALGSFVAQDVGCSVAGGAEGSVVEGAGYSAVLGAGSFGGASLVDSVYCHPCLLHTLPCFCKGGNAVPMSIFLWWT